MSTRFKEPTSYLAHWYAQVRGLKVSPKDFYAELEKRIMSFEFPETTCSRIEFPEGGMLSSKRMYLRVVRGDLAFDVCGAPFGNDSFFISYWLARLHYAGCAGMIATLLVAIPGVGAVVERGLEPLTYYHIDTAQMFQGAIHSIILGYVDELTSTAGIDPIPEENRKPSLKGLTSL